MAKGIPQAQENSLALDAFPHVEAVFFSERMASCSGSTRQTQENSFVWVHSATARPFFIEFMTSYDEMQFSFTDCMDSP